MTLSELTEGRIAALEYLLDEHHFAVSCAICQRYEVFDLHPWALTCDFKWNRSGDRVEYFYDISLESVQEG